MFIAALAGMMAGISTVGLISITQTVLSGSDSSRALSTYLFIGLSLIILIGGAISQTLIARLGQQTIYDLRLQLSRKIAGSPLEQLEGIGPHAFLASLTEDTNALASAVIFVPSLFIDLMTVVGAMSYQAWLDWRSFLLVYGFMIVASLGYLIPMKKSMIYLNRARGHWDAVFESFRALTDGIKELKLHSRRRQMFFTDLQSSASEVQHQTVKGVTIQVLAVSYAGMMFFAVIGLVLFLLPALLNIDVKTVTGYALIGLFIIGPIRNIFNLLPVVTRAQVALAKIEGLGLSLMPHGARRDRVIEPDPPPYWEKIELRGVKHTYRTDQHESPFSLGPFDLTFKPGELVFIVGGNGSGKTTLVKLLTGLYDIEAGEIRLNGQRITEDNRELYRHHFSVVFSDCYIFKELLGLEGLQLDQRATKHLQRLQLEGKVEVKGGRLSTVKLSQGQRKRLALMTAYLENRPIYIFDEWAADQDPVFKEIFYYVLLPELKAKGKTVIAISHDDRYYHLGDRMIKLEYGQIVFDKTGCPDEFLLKSPAPAQ